MVNLDIALRQLNARVAAALHWHGAENALRDGYEVIASSLALAENLAGQTLDSAKVANLVKPLVADYRSPFFMGSIHC